MVLFGIVGGLAVLLTTAAATIWAAHRVHQEALTTTAAIERLRIIRLAVADLRTEASRVRRSWERTGEAVRQPGRR